MVYPLLPFLVVGTLGASATVLGLIEGLAECLPSLVKVYVGRLSDRLGRRKSFAVFGYGLSTCGKLLLALASGWAPVLAGRVVDRLGKGIRSAPRDALIAETTDRRHRGHAFGFHKSMDTAGATLGVLVAYIILTTASDPAAEGPSPLRVALWVSVAPALLAVLLLSAVREPAVKVAPPAPPTTNQGLRARWRSLPPRLRIFLVVSLIFSLAGSTNQFLLLRAQELLTGGGESPSQAAATVCLFYLLYNLTYTAASYPFGRLSDTVGRRPVLIAGYALYALIYACFAMNRDPAWCWALFGIYGLYPALTEGVEKAFISDHTPREVRATVLGLHGTLQAIGLLPASVIGGLLWDLVTPDATFWFAAFMGLLAAAGMMLIPRSPVNLE